MSCKTLRLTGSLMSVSIEEPDHAFGWLKGLDEAIEQNPIETSSISEPNVMLVVHPTRRDIKGEAPA